MTGIYIHVPFCASFCNYCNFYSVKRLAQSAFYPDALRAEMERRLPPFVEALTLPATSRSADYTLYIGGGTPSVLGIERLTDIIRTTIQLVERLHSPVSANFREVTVEVNPDDITPHFASALRTAGATRISIGFQSLHDTNLQWMGRRHTAAQAVKAYQMLRDAGIGNISIDLIFGYTGLTQELWQENLKRVIDLAPEHISGYQMSIEPSTPLGRAYEKGEYLLPSQEECSRQYALMQEILCNAGYMQYEISNFARPGYQAIHNSNYWNGTPYIGFGPGAHSYSGIKRDPSGSPYASRCWNSPNITAYLRGETKQCSETLNAQELFNEAIMLGLRTTKGAETTLLNQKYLRLVEPQIEEFIQSGKMERTGTRLHINPDYFFISDSIIRELLVI